jgi:hypothetical protein
VHKLWLERLPEKRMSRVSEHVSDRNHEREKIMSESDTEECSAWGGRPGESMGLICTEPRDHKGDHVGCGGTPGRNTWPNVLNKVTRVEAARAMALHVGATRDQVRDSEAAGRQSFHEERAGRPADWQANKQPSEALDFVYMEAWHDERIKECAESGARKVEMDQGEIQ